MKASFVLEAQMSTHKDDNCFLFFSVYCFWRNSVQDLGFIKGKCVFGWALFDGRSFSLLSHQNSLEWEGSRSSGKRVPRITEDNHGHRNSIAFMFPPFMCTVRELDVTHVRSQRVWSKTHQVNVNTPFDCRWSWDKPSRILWVRVFPTSFG